MVAAALDIIHDVALAKIRPPRRTSASIDREAAYQALKGLLSRKIVIVESPLGYAKSGFLGEACRRLAEEGERWRTAWLTVDGADDHERMQRHIVEAWKSVWPELESSDLMELYARDPSLYTIAVSNFLTGEANDPDMDYVLFVDNLHLADEKSAARLLDEVAQYFPSNYHMVVSGNYRLHELVGLAYREEACLFPSKLLVFTPQEVRAIVDLTSKAMDNPIEASDAELDEFAAHLWDVTRGWPLGVRSYLDALGRGVMGFSTDIDVRTLGQLLNRFFHDGVLDVLPADLQRFVVLTALTDCTCPDLCDAIMGRSDSKYVLRDLHARGCFVDACEGAPEWFSYHPLFRRWLRRKQEKMNPAELHAACRTASSWFEERGMRLESAKCMLMTSDPVFVEDSVSAMGYATKREAASFFSWIESIPASRFEVDPQLALQVAWGYLNIARIDEVMRWVGTFRCCVEALEGEETPDVDIVSSLMHNKCLEMECRYEESIVASERHLETHADVLTLRQRYLIMQSMAESCMRLGRFDDALKYYLQAEVMAELGKSVFFVALCRMGILSIRLYQGKFKDALELAEKALRECPESVVTYGSLLSIKGFILTEMGRYKEAEACVERARSLLSALRNVDMFHEANAVRAAYLARVGQGALAFRLITKTALEIGDKRLPRSIDLLVALVQGRVALSMGYVSEARSACRHLQERAGRSDTVYRLAGAALAFAVEDAEGRHGSADEVLPFIDEANACGLRLCEMHFCIRTAERCAHEGSRSEALLYVSRALQLQAGQHIVGPFLVAGGHVRSLLHEIVDVRKSGGEIRQLAKAALCEFGGEEDEGVSSQHTSCPSARFGLTEREREVLELLDAGLSRREIAEALTVSLNTVKSHVSSIYNKLGVTNRVDAFAVVHDEED